MKLTKKWLEENNACQSSYDYVIKNGYIGLNYDDAINKAMAENRFSDANWYIVRLMTRLQKVEYAVYAARQVLHLYEEKYLTDNRPRMAIEATEAYMRNPCKKTRQNAVYAADAAYSAYNAAGAAAGAAAAYSAYNAVYSVYAADAAYSAYAAAAYATAAYATAAAYSAGAINLKPKIINNGLDILKKGK